MVNQRLIYRSRAVSPENLDRDLSEILRVAKSRNRACDITGALAFCDGNFVQVIEGPPAQIERLMAAIERDPRHSDIQVLGRWAASHRLFGGWAMASAPTFEIAASTRKGLLGATCGLEMVTTLFGLANRSPILF